MEQLLDIVFRYGTGFNVRVVFSDKLHGSLLIIPKYLPNLAEMPIKVQYLPYESYHKNVKREKNGHFSEQIALKNNYGQANT